MLLVDVDRRLKARVLDPEDQHTNGLVTNCDYSSQHISILKGEAGYLKHDISPMS